jgi:hypothetical protein
MSNSSSNPSNSLNLGNYGSETTSIDNFATGGAELSRADRLEENKKYKQDLLSQKKQFANLDNSFTELEDGTIESNRNKVWNDLSDQEFQDLYNYTVQNKVLTTNEDGSFSFNDGTSYNGRTRRVYLFGSQGEDNEAVKLGIARGDLDSSKARYIPNEETGYGWAPGFRGVDTNKELLDILVPENVAKMLEGVAHGRKKALEGRAVKDLYTRTVEDKFPSFNNLQDSEATEVPQQENVEAAPKVGGLFGKALRAIADTRGWDPQDSNNLINFMDKVAEIESNGIVDRKQGDSEDGIGRGKYQFETSKGSGASKTTANRLFTGLPKLGIDVSEIPEADRAELSSNDPDFSKLSEDVQDLAFLVDKAEADGVDLTAIAKGEIPAADAWLTTHWKGSEEEAPGKLAMWQERFGNEEATPLVTDVVETETPATPTTSTEEDPFLANIKETLEAYKDYQEPFTREQLGSGSSEYYINKEALFGKEGEYNEEAGKKLFKQYIRDLDKKGRIQDVVDVEADRAARFQANRRWMAENASALDQTLNTLQGFGATFVAELLVNPLDAIGDITGAYDLGTEEEKSEYLNKAFGYNPEAAAMAMEEIGKQWDIAANSELSVVERAAAAGNGVLEAFTTPEMLGTSLGALLAWVSPGKLFTMLGKGTKYADTVKRIDKLVDAGKLTKQAGKAKKAKAFISVDGAKSFLTKQSGFIASALGNVNNQYEEFVQNNNGVELTGADKAKWFAGRFAVQMVNQNLDKFTDVSIIKNPGLITAIVPAIKQMTEKEFANVAKSISKGVVKSVENMGKEAAQEYTQTMMELFNSRFGSAQFKDVEEFTAFITDERNTREAGIAALSGAGGSQQFEVVGSIGPAIGLTGQAVGSLVRRSSKNKATVEEVSEEVPAVDPEASAEDLSAATTEADTTASRTASKYAKMFGQDELVMLDAAETLENQEVVPTPSLQNALDQEDMSFADIISEIEAAEVVIDGRAGTERATQGDTLALNVLRRAKLEASKKAMEAEKGLTLGSGFSPEDVVETYLEAKVSVEGNLDDFTEEEKTLVNTYLTKNGAKPYRFKNIQARIDGKDAEMVYEDSMNSGTNSATNRRARLARLVNTPGVNKKAVQKEIAGIKNFLNTQEERKGIVKTAINEVQADLDTYNKNRSKPGVKVVKPKSRYEIPNTNNYIQVVGNPDGSYKIQDNSKAILDSVNDTIDHLQTTLNRYRKATTKVLGKDPSSSEVIDVPVETMGNEGIKKSREKHKKLYDKTKPTKVITDEKDSPKWWKKDGDYTLLNESKVAKQSTEFTEDDVVLLTTLNFKKGSTASKVFKKAIEAGATIVVDEPIDNKQTQKKIATLSKSYGGGFVEQDSKKVILPRAKAVEISNKNKEKQKAKRRENAIKASLVKAFDVVQSAKEEKRKVTKEEQTALTKAKKAAKEYFKGENSEKNMRDYVTRILGKEGETLTADLEAIALSDGLDSKAYTERLGNVSQTARRIAEKKVRQKIERLEKGGTLVKQWKAAEAEAKKGGKALNEWIKDTFGDSAKAIGKKLLGESAGKAAEGTRKIYAYKEAEKNTDKEAEKNTKKKTGKNTYKITSSLKDAKQFADQGVYQVIEVNPEKYVQLGEATVLNTLNIEELKVETVPITSGTVEGLTVKDTSSVIFNDFVEESVNSLKATIKELDLKRSILPFELIDSPASSLIYNDKGELNANVAVAVKVALYNYIKNNGYLMSKDFKSEEDIAKILGKDPAELSDSTIAAMQDKGLLFKTSADSIGKDIAKLLGLKPKSSNDVDAQLFSALTTDLGQIALAVGTQKEEGILEISSMDSVKFAKEVLGKTDTRVSESDAKVNFVKIKNEEKAEDATLVVEILNNTLPNMDVRRKEPMFTAPTDKQKAKATKKIRKERLGVDVAGKSKEAMEALIDTEMVADMPLVRFVVENKDRIKKLLGYVPLETEDGEPHPDLLKLSYKEQQVQASKNRDIEQEIAHLEWLNGETDKDTNKVSMWFNYFFSKNGRFFADSNTINPQNNKHLHRFTVQPKEHNNTYKREGNKFKVGGKDVTTLVHYALAQGFGFATDKKSEKEITEFATAALNKFNSVKALNEARETFLEQGSYDLGNDLEVEIEHLGHALQAFQFIEDSLTKPGKFDSSITAEFDAVTSGFALKLLQMPIVGKKLYTWLGKVGVFKKDDENLNKAESPSMNNILSLEGFLDSYQFLASSIKGITYKDVQTNAGGSPLLKANEGYPKDLWDAVSKVLPSVDPEGGISSDLRNLFKYPFMTFNYASSIKSIRGRLKGTMQDDIAKKISKIDLDNVKDKEQDLVKMLAVFAETDNIKVLKQIQSLVRTQPLERVKLKGSSLGAYLDVMIDASYGAQVEEVLNAEFQPFVEAQDAINSSFKAMFEIFKVSFEEKLRKARKEGVVSFAKEKEIYQSLIKQWPAIRGPLGNMEEEFSTEGTIGVYSMETASPYGIYAGRKAAQSYLTPEASKAMGGSKSISTSHMIKSVSAAISAGSVVPIHYIDGAVMATAITEMGGGMTTIHDAIMPNLLRMGEAQASYNRATIEVSAGYSFVDEIVKSLDRAVKNTELFSEDGPTVYQKAEVMVGKDSTNAASFLIDTRNTMAKLANNVNTKRKELFEELNKGASVMHMAGSSDGVFNIDQDSQIEYKEIDMYTEIKDNTVYKNIDGMTIEDLDDSASKHCK